MNFLRTEALARSMGLSARAITRQVEAGLMVSPVRLGARAIAFPQAEVEVITRQRVAGRSDAEIRALVKQLHAQRELHAEQLAAGVAA